jgi:hypothetical protein
VKIHQELDTIYASQAMRSAAASPDIPADTLCAPLVNKGGVLVVGVVGGDPPTTGVDDGAGGMTTLELA